MATIQTPADKIQTAHERALDMQKAVKERSAQMKAELDAQRAMGGTGGTGADTGQ